MEYELEVNLSIHEVGRGSYEGLRVSNTYKVKAEDLFSILKILAELEAFTRNLCKAQEK